MNLRVRLGDRFLRSLWAATRSQIAEAVVPGSGGIALIGDSITHLGKWELLLPDQPIRNFGIAGERSEHLLLRLEPLIAMRPAKVFILIGTNDLGVGIAGEQAARHVDRLLEALQRALPECRVYLQAVMPRARRYAARVQALNALYRQAADRHGATFIDLYPAFDDGSGELRAEYTADRLHLNGPGYLAWKQLLLPYLSA